VTASNLVKVDTRRQQDRRQPHPVNPAGFVIQAPSTWRAPTRDACCTPTPRPASPWRQGARPHQNSFYGAQFTDRVGYHPSKVELRDGEKPRLSPAWATEGADPAQSLGC